MARFGSQELTLLTEAIGTVYFRQVAATCCAHQVSFRWSECGTCSRAGACAFQGCCPPAVQAASKSLHVVAARLARNTRTEAIDEGGCSIRVVCVIQSQHLLRNLGRSFSDVVASSQELCDSAGVRVVPKLAFEKWRFCAKWQEDNLSEGGSGGHENGSKKAKNKEHSDPLLPTGRFVKEPGLIADLVWGSDLCSFVIGLLP